MRAAFVKALAFVVLVTTASGCPLSSVRTFQYRAVQADFMAAVRDDNVAAVDPLAKSAAGAGYPQIVEQLTPERIAELDPRLRPNAWVIRAYSQWGAAGTPGADTQRLTTDAVASAESGIGSIAASGLPKGSRDEVLLTLLPALAIDRHVGADWDRRGRALTPQSYASDFAPRFEGAVTRLDAAADAETAATPNDAKYYLTYQRWRIVQNWSAVILSIAGADATRSAREAALTKLQAPNGVTTLTKYGDTLRDAIPDGHPLRALIAAQGA